ncbi:AAA ATPase central domain protein [Syntrophobotulus glycolicus DSM 8271]|uniref:AAA ATPase central domain protein n=1 Tax=Syntrophobotulus glycolicus (strain DSM 8271 / FlGlyR) TaxID=645991 RepID=F0SWK9_SYNGF|nr:AAA family ATPase [Syntrophobotulus glycolicus]ADY56849.1 AAA ATPase central domain protein [Syntrophobotulus glycolicus DSM 8271]
MKANYIINLVSAHSSGNESQFEKVLSDLIHDEEKKGNSSLALSLKNAYSTEKRPANSTMISPISSMSFSVQSVAGLPKDKDSTLDLVEILQPTIMLKDVALSEKASDTIQQIIDEQKKSDELLKSGVVPTNRILLCGPPGCGKTMTANALAAELGLSIAYVRLDGLVSSYLGQTGTNIRKIFEFVKGKRIMLFLDEFDAIAKKRDDSHELGELKRVVTTLLQNLDEMQANVFLVAATNHHHLLDPAIWRRFDISILLEEPNESQREKIVSSALLTYLRDFQIDPKKLIVLTDGMSGAQMQTFLQSLGKYCVMSKEKGDTLEIEEIGKIWLKHAALYVSEDSDDFMRALSKLQKSGIPIRTLEAITGIPKSTLSYRFGKEGKINE